jgi:hypothetical protein
MKAKQPRGAVNRTAESDPMQTCLACSIDWFSRSRQLNPLDTAAYAYWTAIATTHFVVGNSDEGPQLAEIHLDTFD